MGEFECIYIYMYVYVCVRWEWGVCEKWREVSLRGFERKETGTIGVPVLFWDWCTPSQISCSFLYVLNVY